MVIIHHIAESKRAVPDGLTRQAQQVRLRGAEAGAPSNAGANGVWLPPPDPIQRVLLRATRPHEVCQEQSDGHNQDTCTSSAIPTRTTPDSAAHQAPRHYAAWRPDNSYRGADVRRPKVVFVTVCPAPCRDRSSGRLRRLAALTYSYRTRHPRATRARGAAQNPDRPRQHACRLRVPPPSHRQGFWHLEQMP